ncbi:NAD(P)H-binding protein [Nocardia sp. NEAU-G5]|uniref:NAD(P)H-binding protein n=1 Tax=Nocardia albiluteola TaxID=2842303 RepID=A0ABS6B8J9_9NOCA|nr:NmrA family NAD(P)-binding protein [Nocardia albiluteola]MBU3065756.1 NAD(P)H-binding protein [Nocardia albiluteola]
MNGNLPTILVLGATGKTGSRVVSHLAQRAVAVRTAARSGADIDFDWSDRETYAAAVESVDRIYLMAPVLRTDFAPDVAVFLDAAEAAGVQHVTFLSAYGMEHAPEQVATRAVELDLIDRRRLGHTILRPAWFMQNFSETFLRPIDGAVVVPTGNGSEAFIDVEDIAAVAADTLADPGAHAAAEYSLTGPQALTVADAAAIIGRAAGRSFVHQDPDRDTWVAGVLATGIPAEYGAVLRQLTATIAAGNGSRPNDTVEKITGHPARTFDEFTRANASAWKDAE